MQKRILIIIGIIILVAIIGGAFLWTQKSKTPVVDDWKTYSNTEYGFEIKYPENLQEPLGTGETIYVGALSINIVPNIKNLSPKDFVLDSIPADEDATGYKSGQELIIGGMPAYELDGYPAGYGGILDLIFVAKDSRIFRFEFPSVKQSSSAPAKDFSNINKIAHQMLSTFKFTK